MTSAFAVRESISPSSNLPSKLKVASLSLVLHMKVRRTVVSVKHTDDYTKEDAYCRHDIVTRGQYSRSKTNRAGLNLPYEIICILNLRKSYALPASFRARSTFSGLSGNLLRRTPVAL